ncbi:MAG: class I SAM-dependent RNA methyltransferase [Hyphomicrobiaceae bacterium]|nr:class I SAM-dependent RNA methyltransferase [Hyphomicrobiaceae bacterium]
MREIEIARLGSQGDGIATLPEAGAAEGTVYVPFALEGERVRVTIEGASARLGEVLVASPDRVSPACIHFMTCGGCTMQHLQFDRYAAWKRQLVVDALAQRGITTEIGQLVRGALGDRRRAIMSAKRDRRGRGGVRFGFHEAMSHEIVDLAMCPVLAPPLAELIEKLRPVLAALPRWEGEARVTLIAADNGIDASVDPPSPAVAATADVIEGVVAALDGLSGIVRFSYAGDVIYQRDLPRIAMGRASVVVPAGVFLQASGLAERTMAALITGALGKKVRRVADLFAGVGAFTFPLAERQSVLAVDSDGDALAALRLAARGADGLKPIETKLRDLFREPLSRKELEGFDAVVFDPPRAGAKAQAEMIAKSKVPLAVAVSCNPATLARDVRILMDGGFRLQSLTPVDQFVYTAHVEAVAVLAR